MIDATDLGDIQAELEASSYKGKRKPRRSASDAEPTTATKTRKSRKKEPEPKSEPATTPKNTGRGPKGEDAALPPHESDPAAPTKARKNSRPEPDASPQPIRRARLKKAAASSRLPPRLQPTPEAKHHDLKSYMRYFQSTGLSEHSNVHQGTLYEYTVAKILQAFNFNLQRTGRRNDLGIDLIGHWRLPTQTKWDDETMPVIIQCKTSKATPAMVRELEGTYAGAPAGWRGDHVLGLLVTEKKSITRGVQQAAQRSRWPLGIMQVGGGRIKQFLWNNVAKEKGLEGLGVAVRYKKWPDVVYDEKLPGKVGKEIVLTWMGKPWRPLEVEGVEEITSTSETIGKEVKPEKMVLTGAVA
jgi:hypothetical protein